MDIYTNIMTSSAVSVTTFKYKQSVIIIFAQNSKSDSIVTSTVYEFKENTIDIIQFLPTNKPMSIHHYTCNNHHFVLMINKMQVSSVYLWDGSYHKCIRKSNLYFSFFFFCFGLKFFRSVIRYRIVKMDRYSRN